MESSDSNNSSNDDNDNQLTITSNSTKTLKVALWLMVENNSKYVRGKSKVRQLIEDYVLRPYSMEKPDEKGSDYVLTISYHTAEELDKRIYELLKEANEIADMRHCYIEADINALDDSERNW